MQVADFEPDDTINDVKLKAGGGYLFVKKRKWVSSRSLLGGRDSISKHHLQGVLTNMGAVRSLRAASYSLQDLLALNLDGEYDVCVALGQSMPAHVPVNPKFYKGTQESAVPDLKRLLLDYLPVVGDLIYRCAEVPNAALYLTHASFWPSPARPLRAPPALVRTVKCLLPSRSNHPVPLARAFETLHATEHVPVLRLNSSGVCRVHRRIEFLCVLGDEEALTCVFSPSFLCHFLESGEVELTYTPAKPQPLHVCSSRIRSRLNPFLALLNRAMGTAYPDFEEVDHVVNMTVQFEYAGEVGQPRTSSRNVAQRASADPLQRARLGFADGKILPLHMRLEGGLAVVSNIDNPAYLPYLTNFEEYKEEEVEQEATPNLKWVGLNDPLERPDDQEVYDFMRPAHVCRYVQTVHPATGVRAGDLPLGIQSFTGGKVFKAATGSFIDCISAVLRADFRLLVGDLDDRFGAYPDVLAAFATNPRHPLLQGCARDNFVRFLRGEPDHTYLWDLVCRPGVSPDGFNLVLFIGDCAQEAVVAHKVGCPFDPSRRSILLWRRGDLYSLLQNKEAAVFAFSDFDFLKKMKVDPVLRPPITPEAILHKWGGTRVVHRGRVVGVLTEIAGSVGLLPCASVAAPKTVLADGSTALADMPRPSLQECRAFLEKADARLACRPLAWVEAAGRCVGILTESRHFAPCAPCPPPKGLEAVTVQELKNPYPVRNCDAMLAMVFREHVGEVEWVEALPPELQTYPRYVRRKLLVPRHLRPKCVFQKTVVVNGVPHDVEEESIY